MDDPTQLPPAESHPVRVLVVEDNSVDRLKIRRIVDHDPRLELAAECTTVEEAFRHLAKGVGVEVMLLDLNLADSSGISTVERVLETFAGLPIVVLTGLADDEQLGRSAISRGAQDYLCKGDLTASTLFRSVSFALERSLRMQNEVGLRDLRRELDLVTSIRNLLKPPTIPQLPGYAIAGFNRAVRLAGGDHYDIFQFGDGSLGLMVVDVAGHDFTASQIVLAIRPVVRAIAPLVNDLTTFVEILDDTVSELSSHEQGITQFASCFVAKINPSSHLLEYVGAGHDAFVFDANGNVTHLDSTSPPLGLSMGARFVAAPATRLEAGQTLVILTDGFAEAPSNGAWQFSTERVLATLRANLNHSPEGMFDCLINELMLFLGNRKAMDDMTGIIVKSLDCPSRPAATGQEAD